MLEGDEQGHVETVCIFIDLDIDSETGYLTKGIGADYMIKIYGREGKVISSYLFEFNSQNQHSWNRFMERGFVNTAVFEGELESRLAVAQLVRPQLAVFVEPEPLTELAADFPFLLRLKRGVRLILLLLPDDDGDQVLNLELAGRQRRNGDERHPLNRAGHRTDVVLGRHQEEG